MADGGEIITIEGLEKDGKLHPIQEAFWENHALQCGFCTPGMIMTLYDFLRRNPRPTEEEVRRAIEGNLFRASTPTTAVVIAIIAAISGLGLTIVYSFITMKRIFFGEARLDDVAEPPLGSIASILAVAIISIAVLVAGAYIVNPLSSSIAALTAIFQR